MRVILLGESMEHTSILVLGLGNDIMGDDAVGLIAAREVRARFGDAIKVLEAPIAGFAMLDLLEGYTHVLLLDAVMTAKHPAGTVMEFRQEDFHHMHSTSPHYVGIPEVFSIAKTLNLPFPGHIRILAMEVADPNSLREGLTKEVGANVHKFADEAEKIVRNWLSGKDSFNNYFEKAEAS